MDNFVQGRIYKIVDDYDNRLWRGVTFMSLEDIPMDEFVKVVPLAVPSDGAVQVGYVRSINLDVGKANLKVVRNPFKALPNAESFPVGSVLVAEKKLFAKVQEDTWHSFIENTFDSVYSNTALDKYELAEVDSYTVATPDGEEKTYS